MAVIGDPTGAMLGAWEARDAIGAGRVNEPGCLTWNELATSDVQKALSFYEGLFGWTSEVMQTGGGPAYTVIRVESAPTAASASYRRRRRMPAPRRTGSPTSRWTRSTTRWRAAVGSAAACSSARSNSQRDASGDFATARGRCSRFGTACWRTEPSRPSFA